MRRDRLPAISKCSVRLDGWHRSRAPSLPKYDIRLGDVAVSMPQDGHPGVLQYDFGKYEQGEDIALKGYLNKPPAILISANGPLEEDELMERRPLRRTLKNIIKKPGYARPESCDILYDQTIHHVNVGGDCSGCEFVRRKESSVPRRT